MTFKFALLTPILLASMTFAIPSSHLAEQIARPRVNRQLRSLDSGDPSSGAASNINYNSAWAGAIWSESNGTFTTVTGTFTVPNPTGEFGSGATIWVGIDGSTCMNAILQTGVSIMTGSDGEATFNAWYEWYPDNLHQFDINIHAGDVIIATVAAYSATSGVAIIENTNTNIAVVQELSSSFALCGANAEWIVEDFTRNGSLVPFPDFGTVTFTSATAAGPNPPYGAYTPSDANITDIKKNGTILTKVTTNKESITIKYVG